MGVALFRILLHLQNGIFGTSSGTIAEASVREQGFKDRYHLLCHGLLDGSVCDGGNAKLSHSAVRLRDLHSPDWFRRIFSAPYPVCQLVVMFLQPCERLVYGHPIDSRRSLVCLHPFKSSVQVIPVQYLLQKVRLCTVPFLPYPVE